MKLSTLLVAAGVLLWLASPWLAAGWIPVFTTIALYAPIVIGLSMLAGYAGQVSLGQAAFFGLGAYMNGILTVHLGLNPWLAAPLAVAATAAVAYLVGGPVLTLRGHFLVIATLGFNIIVEVLMREVKDLTGGPSGLSGIASLGAPGVRSDIFYFYASTVTTALAILLSHNLVRSRVGRALQAIRTSEMAAESLGVEAGRLKDMVFAWSAALAGVSGALYSGWLGFISPSTFDLGFSVVLLTMSVVGGAASIPGALAGTALLELLREAIKDVARSLVGGSPEYEIVVFGGLLVTVMLFAPEGLWPKLAGLRSRGRALSGDASPDVDPHSSEAHIGSEARPPFPPTAGDQGSRRVLEVQGVTRAFGGLVAVNNVSFHVNSGEIFAIIGPNGAGKTTLLNLISGVITPTSGSIWIDGRRVTGGQAQRVARLGVSRTFQTPRTFPLMDVLDNVKVGLHRVSRHGFVLAALGLNRREESWIHTRAISALAGVGMASKAHAPTTALPFGNQRLVELARALASQPTLLLLDEPASGLSDSERQAFVQLLRRIKAQGTTVILVEHNVNMVMQLADRIAVLHHGELLAQGTPTQVLQDRRVVEAYLGSGHHTPTAARAVTPAAGQPLLEISGLRAGYGIIEVLRGVHLEVKDGEVVAVLGRNGAGKSTLMKAITGLIPSSGNIAYRGREFNVRSPEQLAALGLVLVPERRQLLESMTVEDHLVLGAYCRYGRTRRQEISADMERCYRLFPILRQRRLQTAKSLSGGQQQMLAIARALMARPRLLLLDEPLLGLAPKVVDDVLMAIAGLAAEGIGVLISEQNVAAILHIADRAYVLENGRIVMADTAENLMGSRELEMAFLGADVRPGEAAG
jgi:ABC-type branched-subunit amino acid transport system ATPase component/ABC-type branched-subunit amino acid transport system permease subunit